MFQCMSSVFPQYFQGAETFDILISFLKDEDEGVGKCRKPRACV